MFNASIEVLVLLAVFLIYALYYEYRLMTLKNYIDEVKDEVETYHFEIEDKVETYHFEIEDLEDKVDRELSDLVEWADFDSLDKEVGKIARKVFPNE